MSPDQMRHDVIRRVARKRGITAADYEREVAAGHVWCRVHRGWVSRLDAGQTGVWTAASGVCLPCKRAKRRHAVEEAE